MLRKDKVYLFLKKMCKGIKKDEASPGFSANYVAKELNLARNNVSSDLNDLVKEGKVVKIKGRPTMFLDKEWAMKHGVNNTDIDSFKMKDDKKTIKMDSFDDLIGSNESLLSPIKQAQAAIMYPPKGLATLLLGESGTGKTTFAEHMYKFAINNGILKKDAPYVVFNCADYANNPQLLMSILFGSIKGAYTGSSSDRLGIVEKANGGVLFLDEVHRLSPEGQEMLFNIIDNNKYRRLGDVEDRKADTLIICATTENPKSTLLETFLRRIPIVIRLPGLKDRSLKERLDIITNFFNREALRVGTPLVVSRDVIVALMLYTPPGNVGELKSLVELITSRGYLDYLINHSDIKINLSHLPDDVKESLLNSKEDKLDAYNLVDFNGITFSGSSFTVDNFIKDPYDFSDEIYKLLEERSKLYKEEKLPQNEIAKKLNKDLEEAFIKYNKGVMSSTLKESELSKFINHGIIDILKGIMKEVFEKFDYLIKEKTFISLAFHIKSLLERDNTSRILDLDEIKNNHPLEFKVAKYIVQKLREYFKSNIVDNEIGFISMILYLTDENEKSKKVGVIVIAHGDSTASSMAHVVNRLLKTDHVKALDMSLEVPTSKILEKALKLSREIDEGKGILLMVDMGSLKVIGEEIHKITGIDVITIDNVSTPVLLDAVHKTLQPYTTLIDIAKSTLELEKNLVMGSYKEINTGSNKKKTILTICTTGEGTAVYLKNVINKALSENDIRGIDVEEMNINDKKEIQGIESIEFDKDIILIAGNIKPQYPNVPFVSLYDIISSNGLDKIIGYIKNGKFSNNISKRQDRSDIYKIVCDALDENLNFLSGKKLMPYLEKYAKIIEHENHIILDNNKCTLILMHLAYLIERLKFEKNTETTVYDDSLLSKEMKKDFSISLDVNEMKNIKNIIK